jgi:WD40 repeat protein/serine/threonine protein kinase
MASFRTEEPMADDLCGRTLRDFVVGKKLDEGGCGTLYRCSQLQLNREAVIKVLHEPKRGNKEAEARFLREAQLASRLDHHFAAHVYAFGVEQEDGLRWIAMEFVPGVTLDQWLIKHGRMSLEQFVKLFECIADVVHHAHEMGIVHRDLKAANVMVIERRGRLIPKLLDFGIAKTSQEAAPATSGISPDENHDPAGEQPHATSEATGTDPELKDRFTPEHAGIGSPAYMAPEQWDDAHNVGCAADIYALGVLAYRALTGRTPFIAQSQSEWRQQHLKAKVPPLGGDLPAALDGIFQRALAKAPEDRHSTALDFAAELRAALMASERELLRSLAQQWDACARSSGLLLSGNVLAGVERWTRRAPSGVLSKLECSYVAASVRHSWRVRWLWRLLVALAVLGAFGVILYRAELQTQSAQQQTALARQQAHATQQLADATATQAEVEEGRQALLHNEFAEAQVHLAQAYQRGDHSAGVAFMLARALQPLRAEQARFTATSGHMWSTAFSPSGRQIVTTDDRGAQVWDAASRSRLFAMPHGDTVYQATYSPDGKRIITAGGDGIVKIWDAANGVLVHKLTHDGKRLRYFMVKVSPDGKLVAAIDMTGAVAHVWNASTGDPVAELSNDASDSPDLAFSFDGHWLATSGGNDVRVFDTATWGRAIVIAGPRIHSLSFDPKGPRLVTGSGRGDASIWAIPSGALLRHLRETGKPVDRVAFSPNGELVVTAARDGAEQVWDARLGALQSQGNYLRGKIQSVEFDPTSKLVVAAGASGTVVVSDAALGMPVTVLAGPVGAVMDAHFDPSSRRVVGAAQDGTARVWDATAPYLRWSSPPINDDCGLIASLEPDRRFIAIGCRDHATRILDTSRSQLVAELPPVTHVDGDFTSAFPAVSAAGDRAAIARGNTVAIYELPSGRLLRTIPHGAAVNAVAFASTGRDVVSGAIDGSLLVTRDNHEPIALSTSLDGIDVVEILPDGRVAAAAGNRLRIYDPDRDAILAEFEIQTRVRMLRTSPDGHRLIAIPSYTGKVSPPTLWDLERYRLIAPLEGHVGRVFGARFVGDAIVTTGNDSAVRLWDGSTGRLRQTYRGSSRFFDDATLSPDGAIVVAGDADGLLRFWDATSARPLWRLPVHESHVIGIRIEGDDIVTRGFTGEVSRWTLPKPAAVIAACAANEVSPTSRGPCAIVAQ